MASRWWVYQRERFPLFGHGPLVLAFSLSAVSFSALLRGAAGWPPPRAALTAFLTSLIFFLQLRIADEFKDAEEDARYRPYRPVPRGLVTLPELGRVFALAGGLQLVFALWLAPALLPLLLVTWGYLALMGREFFARRWLKARPVIYLLSHMLILPLVDLYATSCDWLPAAGSPPPGLAWFLAVSYGNGVVIELGRKIRAPGEEEEGVQTYSALWGSGRAGWVWFAALAVTALLGWKAATLIRFGPPAAAVFAVLVVAAAWAAHRFARQPQTGAGRRFERLAGLWTLALYLSLGVVPLALTRWGGWG